METVEPLARDNFARSNTSVSMCFSYDLYRPDLWQAILPVIDAIEICPDTISYAKGGKIFLDERIIDQLRSVNHNKKVLSRKHIRVAVPRRSNQPGLRK